MVGTIIAFVNLDKTEQLIVESIKSYGKSGEKEEAITKAWKLVQEEVKICLTFVDIFQLLLSILLVI